MKYIDSFEHTEAIAVSGETSYSPWYDISWANELFSFAKFVESETGGTSESITVTLQRYSPILPVLGKDIAAHGALSAPGSNDLEVTAETANAGYTTANKLGMRVRWEFVSSGTFKANNIVTMTMVMYAKRN